jgi:hypothetical protein
MMDDKGTRDKRDQPPGPRRDELSLVPHHAHEFLQVNIGRDVVEAGGNRHVDHRVAKTGGLETLLPEFASRET